MRNEDFQIILAHAGYYKGGIDGDIGEKTMSAIEAIEKTQKKQYPKTFDWSSKRRLIAAGQAALNAWKFEAGSVDGLIGHNTTEAYAAWAYKKTHKKRERVSRRKKASYNPKLRIPRQKDVARFYGKPGREIQSRIVTIKLPFYFRLDWNLRVKTNKISIHKRVAKNLEKALIEVYNHYGEKQWRKLGLDRFAGSYNHRKMRGSNKWSMHAYGVAIDFYAQPNGLRMKCPQARFCGEEYKPFLDIMEKHGFPPAIRLWGKDAMHFQAALL